MVGAGSARIKRTEDVRRRDKRTDAAGRRSYALNKSTALALWKLFTSSFREDGMGMLLTGSCL